MKNNKKDREHFDTCNECNEDYDKREPGEVMYHAFGECLNASPVPEPPFSAAKKQGDSMLWPRGQQRPIGLN